MAERLVDVIKEGQILTVSESIAREEELFILRTHEQTKVLEVPPYEAPEKRKTRDPMLQPKATSRWHSYESEYKKNNVVKDLIDNFHWEISKARRIKNVSRLQLANAIGVPEAAVKMLENGQLPSDDFILVNKVQSYLGINLRRDGVSAPISAISKPTSPVGPVYISKPDYSRNVSLSDLQKMKEKRDKFTPQQDSGNNFRGSDIEIID